MAYKISRQLRARGRLPGEDETTRRFIAATIDLKDLPEAVQQIAHCDVLDASDDVLDWRHIRERLQVLLEPTPDLSA